MAATSVSTVLAAPAGGINFTGITDWIVSGPVVVIIVVVAIGIFMQARKGATSKIAAVGLGVLIGMVVLGVALQADGVKNLATSLGALFTG